MFWNENREPVIMPRKFYIDDYRFLQCYIYTMQREYAYQKVQVNPKTSLRGGNYKRKNIDIDSIYYK